MRKPKSFLRVFTETGPLVALAVAIALLIGIAGPASAQFFNFGGFGGPPQRQAPQAVAAAGSAAISLRHSSSSAAAASAAPGFFPRARRPPSATPWPERNVLVLGDAMADWLGYGLEDAYSEQPDMGVIRKHKTVSGLIKYQPRGEPADWAAAAKGILANEKPDAIVVMLGLHDRVAIREAATEKKTDKKDDKKDARAKTGRQDGRKADAKPADAAKPKPEGSTDTAKTDDKPVDTANVDLDDAAENDTPQTTAPEKSARSGGGLYEFRDERWVELYAKKIEEMIGVLKSKGVPVLWVGLPAIRGPKGTSDMLFLDALYRDAAGKAGITYVDVWDGFVDEAGRFLQKGPDFEGQIRQLRTSDGVYLHQARRAQARALCRARGDAPARLPFRADRAADRTGDARRQCRARPAGAAAAGRTDHAAGGLFRRHRSVARRSGLASGRRRCARRAHAGEG